MQPLALLRSGAKPEFVAKNFANALIQRSDEANEFCWELAANFIKDCFDAINFKLQISVQDVKEQFQNFNWPIHEIKCYVFDYDKTLFKQVEHFIYKLCLKIKELTEQYLHCQNTIMSDESLDGQTTPLGWFMQLYANWDKACKQLASQKISTKFFNEPIARIDYQLLRGFNILRKLYRIDIPILDKICGRLLESVLRGLLYAESYTTMFSGLKNMLHEDFHLFSKSLNTNANFYEKVLLADVNKTDKRDIYDSLTKLLNDSCLNYEDFNAEIEDQIRQNSLLVSNFLISPKMLNVYYHTLTKEINKSILATLLEFLLVLQSKLIDIECFMETFMEAILSLVLDKNEKIGDLAAKVYVVIMKRRAVDEFIYIHCIKFYFACMNNQDFMLRYVKRLWRHFGVLQNLNAYVKPIQYEEKENEKVRVLGAHFLCAFIDYLLEDYAANRETIKHLLRKIIEILSSMNCLITQNILLDIFNTIYKIDIPEKEDDLGEVLLLFQKCAEEKLLSTKYWQYPLLKKWFLLFKKYNEYSENSQRVCEVALCIAELNKDVILELEAHTSALNKERLQNYSCALQKLCIVTQSKYATIYSDVNIMNALHKRIIIQENSNEENTFEKYADQFKILIDVYAIELYTVGLMEMFLNEDFESITWMKERVLECEQFLKSWIENTESLMKQPIVRIKTYFNCLLGLYLFFGSRPKDNILILTNSTYSLFIRTLIEILFKSTNNEKFHNYADDTEVHPLRAIHYQCSMLACFRELHALKYIEINDHYVWRICLYYNLPMFRKFNNELENLMLTLIQHRFHIYKRALPIVIYNLYTQQPPLAEMSIKKAIKAHKNFIDNLSIEEKVFINCHIVFGVIDKIQKALNLKSGAGDRLAPLKHLNIFLQNLKLSSKLKNDMFNEVQKLRRSSLRSVERKSLSEFLGHIKLMSAQEGILTTSNY